MYQCEKCGRTFERELDFKLHQLYKSCERQKKRKLNEVEQTSSSKTARIGKVKLVESAFKCRVATYRIDAPSDDVVDIETFLDSVKSECISEIESFMLEGCKSFKLNMELFAYYIKPTVDAEDYSLKSFNTKFEVITPTTDKQELFTRFFQKILKKSEEFQERDSGWAFVKISHLEIKINSYNPYKGGQSTFLDLPSDIKVKRACINIQNKDDACIAWCVTAALHPRSSHLNRPGSYPHYSKVLNLNGITFPFKLKDISKLETLNNISINVYGLEFSREEQKHTVVGPLHYTKCKKSSHINLLYISGPNSETAGHFVLITNLSRLVSSQISSHKHKKFFCDGCLQTFNLKFKLEDHLQYGCAKVRVDMPKSNSAKKNAQGNYVPESKLSFTAFDKKMKVPFIIIADFESILKPVHTCTPDDSESFTLKTQQHAPFSFAYYIICDYDSSLNKYVQYTGEDCAKVFMERLQEEVKHIYANHLKPVKPLQKLTSEEVESFKSTDQCHICETTISEDKVLDHCHLTGKYRGPAHNACNLNYKLPNFIPVFFHNLSGYDSHLFISELGMNKEKIEVIPTNMEKYISFSKSVLVDSFKNKTCIKLRFLDSFRFMASSIENLAKNLKTFTHVKKYFPDDDQFNLLTRKGVFPYNYVDSFDKLKERRLPDIQQFHNQLT